ncbi:MAG: hypothetical protein OXC28_22055, partial [Defluviicoccus sp.]|nr:hypothetical protein [Defluviicoccus sp.]
MTRAHDSTGAFTEGTIAFLIRVNGSSVNTPATGAPAIAGTATVGQSLQASRGTIADPDGVPSTFAYQWVRVDSGTESDISGATSSSYLLGDDDAGKRVKVKLSFTDNAGHAETRTSAAYPASGTILGRPPLPPPPLRPPIITGEALVSNIGQAGTDATPLSTNDLAQKFTSGANVAGYTLTGVGLRLGAITAADTDSAAPLVRVVRGAATGGSSVAVATLTAGTTTVAGLSGNYTFTAPANTTLLPSTDYWIVIEAASSGGGDVFLFSTNSDSEDSASAAGWSIDDSGLNRAHDSTGAFAAHTRAMRISVNGSGINSPATGAPAIAGTATVGQSLQASQGSVADPDGVPSSFSYQWVRVDSGTDADISGATSSSYLLDAADAGKRVKVKLSFTDNAGHAETRTSAAYPASGTIAAAPPPIIMGATLVGNMGQASSSYFGLGSSDLAQKFTTGAHVGGYNLTSVDIRLFTHPGAGPDTAAPRVRVVRGAAAGSGSVAVATLTAETSPLSGQADTSYRFAAPANTRLRPSTDYWVVVEAASSGGGDVSGSFTLSDAEDGASAAGWSIDDEGLSRNHASTGAFSGVSGNVAMVLRVNGGDRANTPATGTPAIAGTATVGQSLE